MRKRYRNALILVIVLGLLFGVYKFVENKEGKKIEENPTTTVSLFKMDNNTINQVIVETTDRKLAFSKKGSEWTLVEPKNLKIIGSRVEGIALEFGEFNAEKLIEKGAKDFSKYGLDKPTVVTVKTSKGETRSVEIGRETPTKTGYYLKLSGSSDVYSITTYKADTLSAKMNDIRDKEIYTVTPEDVKGFKMEREGKLVFATVKVTDSQWDLTYPISASVNMSSLDSIFNTIKAPTVMNFIDDNPKDLGKYGLKKPSYGFEVQTKKGSYRILCGDEKVKNSEIYAKLSDKDDVFTIDEQLISFVDKPLEDIVEAFAYLADIKSVKGIDVDMDGKTVVSTIELDSKDNADNDKFTVDGKSANMKNEFGQALFKDYYQALIGITMSRLEIGAKPYGKPEITFTYHLNKAPGTMKVEFVSKNENYYYVIKNGKYSNIIVEKDKFDEVRNVHKKLMDEINKQK